MRMFNSRGNSRITRSAARTSYASSQALSLYPPPTSTLLPPHRLSPHPSPPQPLSSHLLSIYLEHTCMRVYACLCILSPSLLSALSIYLDIYLASLSLALSLSVSPPLYHHHPKHRHPKHRHYIQLDVHSYSPSSFSASPRSRPLPRPPAVEGGGGFARCHLLQGAYSECTCAKPAQSSPVKASYTSSLT